VSASSTTRTGLLAACFLAAALCATPAGAQILIKANDDVNIKLGVLGQFQADTIHDTSADRNTTNLFVRRFRLLFAGQVAKKVTFFAETDVPNLGKTVAGIKTSATPVIQDAYAEFKASDAFALDAGFMYAPASHNLLQSAATLLPIDYGAYTFSNSAPIQSTTGRDAGFQARGYLNHNHLEYRLGAFQGHRNAVSSNPLRFAGRLQFNVLDGETAFFYGGNYLGTKKILSFGGSFDGQEDYRAYDVDAFLDYPVGRGVVTGQFDYNRFDGGTTVTGLPKQNDLLVEAGYYIRAAKVTPVLQWVRRDIVNPAVTGDESRVSIGANYYWVGHNANVKAAFTRIAPRGLGTQREFTLQLQIFYF
jgi:Phosphate-selective porin O and P